jgi:CHAD domain-containing protein
VRRTRAALGQIKGVFPAEMTKRFGHAFKQIGQMTNELRDLDVYLLSQERYQALLPASLCADIDPLFDYLSQKRTQVLQEVIQALDQPGYSQTLEAWKTFLSAPPSDDPGAPNAGRPIKALAQERIYKSYQQVVKLGNQILENTADDQLHTLRIEGKKLRYLMEFFAHLFPPQEMNELIKQLKELQDILGDFNDLGVQKTYLLQVAEEMPLPQPQSRKVFLCIMALVDALAGEREAAKASFATTFANFAAPANRKAMRALFVPKK